MINLCLRFISRFGRFYSPFHSLSLYPFHLSIPFTSLSLSSLYESLWRIKWTFSSLCYFKNLNNVGKASLSDQKYSDKLKTFMIPIENTYKIRFVTAFMCKRILKVRHSDSPHIRIFNLLWQVKRQNGIKFDRKQAFSNR